MNDITLTIEQPKLNPYSKRQYNADVFCACCGRGIANRNTCQAVNIESKSDNGETVFAAPPSNWKQRDPVEWASFIGSHCQKRVPVTHKISMKTALRYSHNWA